MLVDLGLLVRSMLGVFWSFLVLFWFAFLVVWSAVEVYGMMALFSGDVLGLVFALEDEVFVAGGMVHLPGVILSHFLGKGCECLRWLKKISWNVSYCYANALNEMVCQLPI